MAYYQDNAPQYLDPVTGQYFTMESYSQPYRPYNGIGYGAVGYNGMYGRQSYAPMFIRKNTGDVSVINKMLKNKQPYQYNAPSIASMFPLMNMPTMGNLQSPQYTGGAGQFLGGNFLGGLLGNASAAPAATTDASSGAGRYA